MFQCFTRLRWASWIPRNRRGPNPWALDQSRFTSWAVALVIGPTTIHSWYGPLQMTFSTGLRLIPTCVCARFEARVHEDR